MYILLIAWEKRDSETWNEWLVGSLEDCKLNLRTKQDASILSDTKIQQAVIFKPAEIVEVV